MPARALRRCRELDPRSVHPDALRDNVNSGRFLSTGRAGRCRMSRCGAPAPHSITRHCARWRHALRDPHENKARPPAGVSFQCVSRAEIAQSSCIVMRKARRFRARNPAVRAQFRSLGGLCRVTARRTRCCRC
jgi:hypothetical protein